MIYARMGAKDFISKVDNAGIILDVRTHMEHDEQHLNMPHQHVPLDQLHPDQFAKEHGLNHESAIYILCKAGMRAKKAADMFVAAGYKNIICVEGGLDACVDCGHVTASKNCAAGSCCGGNVKLSLERQVRVAAGLFVALGAYLALSVHVGFAYVPLVIGLGLVFAGVTNRCGLALLLTKAPWNK